MPLDSPANTTVVRLRATSDTYVLPAEPRVLQYAVRGDAGGLFKVTEDGDVLLAQDLSAAGAKPGKPTQLSDIGDINFVTSACDLRSPFKGSLYIGDINNSLNVHDSEGLEHICCVLKVGEGA